jgi:hypothetical protein
MPLLLIKSIAAQTLCRNALHRHLPASPGWDARLAGRLPRINAVEHVGFVRAFSLPGILRGNKQVEPVARTIPDVRGTQLLDFALRRRRPERQIAMA